MKRQAFNAYREEVDALACDLLDAFLRSTYVCAKCWKRWVAKDHYPNASVETTLEIPKCCGEHQRLVTNQAELN
jgi:hypothetical protein